MLPQRICRGRTVFPAYFTAKLGLTLSLDKCNPPVRIIMWFGFEICAVFTTVRISSQKLSKVIEDCRMWKSKRSATKKDLQNLAGKLQHVATVSRVLGDL